MSKILDNIILRKGNLKDKSEISELCKNIWNGKDYLPVVWNDWINNSNSSFIIADLENEIVAVYHVYNFNSEIWLESLRVKEQYRHQGIANYLIKDLITTVQSKQIDNIRLTTSIENTKSISLFKNLNFNESHYCQYMYIDYNDIEELSTLSDVKILNDYDEISSIFEHMDTTKKYIPIWWRWWSVNSYSIKEYLKNGIAIISSNSGHIDSLLLLQKTNNYGHEDHSQLFIVKGQCEEIKNSLSYVKTSFPEFISSKLFCFPETNSDESSILLNLGFKKRTNLVLMNKSIVSI
jgi:N-acetylglutamate synthase-like GNAT family acetyltransferase